MKIIAIVAVDNNWAIGKNNKLLYNVPIDMKFFKEATTKQIVVYGYNTLLSFPKQQPLPNRINIVLTSKKLDVENLIVANNIQDLEKTLQFLRENHNDKDVFICGGESVYKQLLPICDEALVTKINAETEEADAFFPNLDNDENWELMQDCLTAQDSSSGLTVNFCTYKKK